MITILVVVVFFVGGGAVVFIVVVFVVAVGFVGWVDIGVLVVTVVVN